MLQNRTFDLHFIHARIFTYLRYPHLDLDSRERGRMKSEILLFNIYSISILLSVFVYLFVQVYI